MYISRKILTLSALWSATQLCFATDTVSFPRQEGVEYIDNQFIIEYETTTEGNNAKETIVNNPDKSIVLVNEIPSRNIQVVNFPSKESVKNWLNGAKKGVKYIDEDSWTFPDTQSTTDSQNRNLAESIPYGITHVNALDVTDDNAGERKVCIIDSGYDMDHPDLPSDPSLFTGESFVNNYSWDTDENSHGTHVAGTIVALQDNEIGVVGVIRNGQTKMHISKVFPASGGVPTSTIIDGFQSCVENGSNVINMSLGGGGFTSSFASAIADAENDGILTFASSGNTYGSGLQYPASYEFVISVASITEDYVRSSFSTYNDEVDICAPGSSVLSTVPGGGYSSYSGTSMACPHAAGVAALVWSHYPSLSNEVLRDILEDTAKDLGSTGYDVYYGHGLIDALAAFNAATIIFVPTVSPRPSGTPSSSPTPVPTISPRPSGSPSTSAPTLPCLNLDIDLLTDEYASETRWEVTDPNGAIVESDDVPLSSYQYNYVYCLPPKCAYTFTIYDTFGDGICCGYGEGSYSVAYDGVPVRSGGIFGSQESATFGCVTSAPISSPTVSPRPSGAPSTSAPTSRCINLEIDLLTDRYASETRWEVTDPDGAIVESDDVTEDSFQYNYAYCLPPKCAYTFTIYDTFGDGICCGYGNGSYSVTYDGEQVISGGNFGSQESATFGCDDECADSTSNFALSNGAVGCPFIAEDLEKCDVTAPINVKSHCPFTCSACAEYGCEDSEAEFTLELPSGVTRNINCGIIPGDQVEIACAQPTIFSTCRKTCSYCNE